MRGCLLWSLVACSAPRSSGESARVPPAADAPARPLPTDAQLVDSTVDVAPDAGTTSKAGPRIDPTGIDPSKCPVVALPRKAAFAIKSVRTVAELERALVKAKQPETTDPLELPALVKDSLAFGVEVHAGYHKDSTSSYRHHHAVFVLPASFVYTGKLFETSSTIPPPCGAEVKSVVIAARVIDARTGGRYGHVRLRRRDIPDSPTLPSVLATPSFHGSECEVLETFRIEDHVIDLAGRKHVAAIAQVYRAPLYEEVDAPAIAFDRIAVENQSILVDDARCTGAFRAR